MKDDKSNNIVKTVKAVIFDMDGVISDTQGLQASIVEEILRKHDIEISAEEITAKYAGVTDKEFLKIIFKNFRKELSDLDQIIKEKQEKLMELAKGNISAISGAIELITKLYSQGISLGVASASPTEFIKLVFSELNLNDKFRVITSAEEVKKGKPDPAIFLLTAQKLSVRPETCVVIEDGINGMIAAKKAGMRCIGLVPKKNQETYPADLLVSDLRQVKIEDIIHLFKTRL